MVLAPDNGPCAYNICLGWCVVEPVAIDMFERITLSCKRVLVQGVFRQDRGKRFLKFKTKVKENDFKEMLAQNIIGRFSRKTWWI